MNEDIHDLKKFLYKLLFKASWRKPSWNFYLRYAIFIIIPQVDFVGDQDKGN